MTDLGVGPNNPRLVGRDQEISALQEALDLAGSGQPHVLELIGPAGIGKTALLRYVVELSDQRGYQVHSGRGTEFEADIPFGLASDVLGEALAEVARSKSPGIDQDQLEIVLPRTSGSGLSPTSPRRTERFYAYRAVCAGIEALADGGPLVIGFDDLHWADQGSVELLSHLLTRLPDAPLLLILAYRPTRLAQTLAGALEAIRRDGTSTRLELPPLSPAAAKQLVGSGVDDRGVERLYRDSGGNPFFLEQMARTATVVAAPNSPSGSVPHAVAVSIESEVKTLSKEARASLQGAAVVGEPFDMSSAAAAAGIDPQRSDEVVDELLRSDLIVPTNHHQQLSFRHPLIRRAIYESAELRWRTAAHQRMVDALRDRKAPMALIAHHLMRCATPGDQEAIETLANAGYASMTQAPASAAEFLKVALELIGESEDPGKQAQRLDLLTAEAMALGSAGNIVESRTALRRILEVAPSGTNPVLTQASIFAAMLENLMVRHQHAEQILLDAIQRLPAPDSPEAADLRIELSVTHFFLGNFEETALHARQAVEIQQSDPVVRASSYALMALSAYSLGERELAESSLDASTEAYELATDEQLASHMDVGCWLASAEVGLGRADESLRHTERSLQILRSTGNSRLIEPLLYYRSRTFFWKGDIAGALEAAQAAYDASVVSPVALLQPWVLGLIGLIEVARGNFDEAFRWGERSLAADENGPVMSGYSTACFAEALVEGGEPDRALQIAEAHIDKCGLPLVPQHRSMLRHALFGALLNTGQDQAAADVLGEAEQDLQRFGHQLEHALSARMRARLLLSQAEAEPAIEAARESTLAAEKVGAVIETAVSRTVLGEALILGHEREQAIRDLELAEQQLAVFGATHYRNDAARLLRSIGRRVASATSRQASGAAASLTPREQEVAELVTAGKTNRQIGKALFISEKTVERHLSQVFAKLGVKSRVSVASVMERQRLDGPTVDQASKQTDPALANR